VPTSGGRNWSSAGPVGSVLDYADRVALDTACRSFELHGVTLDRTCRHCGTGTAWPCTFFERAHRVIRLLTAEDQAAMGFLCGNHYVQAQPISAAWLEGRS
jgi:hypothetical protein